MSLFYVKGVVIISIVKKRQYVFLSKWDKQNLICACLFHNPCCTNVKKCEEIELTLSPWEDLEELMRARKYKRINGALKQY